MPASHAAKAGTVFDHCRGAEDVWTTFYAVACVCHPAQGGQREDMAALCREARDALTACGAEWPASWPAVPNLFDVFCLATGTPNPFDAARPPSRGPSTPKPFHGSSAWAPWCCPAVGAVELVFAAQSSDASRRT